MMQSQFMSSPFSGKETPAFQEVIRKIHDPPNFRHYFPSLRVTGEFYELIVNNYKVFPTGGETAKIKGKLTKIVFIMAIQHLIEIF